MDSNKSTISPAKEAPTSLKRRSRWLRWLRWPLRLVAVLVIVLILLVMATQTPWGTARIERFAENQVSGLLNDARLDIGSLSGSFLWGVSGHEVKLFAGDSLVASIDTVEVSYNVLGFLAGKIDLGDIRLVRPEVMARQRADSTWDLLSVLPPTDPAAEPGEPIEVSVDMMVVTNGSLRARFQTGRDSLVALESLQVAASGFSLGEDLELERISLEVRGEAASLPAAVFLDVEASVGARTFRCDRCVLTSERSRLDVNGHFDWGGQSDMPGADLAVVVDSLAMADLSPFLPMVDGTQVVSGNASLRGPLESISAEVDLEFGVSQIEIRGALVRGDSVSADLDLAVKSVDPAVFWTAFPMSGSVSGELVIDLDGESIPSLTGSAMLRIHDSILNDRHLKTSSVSVDVLDGLADITGVLELPASRLEIDGWMTPFADTTEWSLSGSAVSDDLGHIYSAAGDIESVSLRFQTEGNSASRADYFRNTDVYLDQLRYAGFIADSTHLTADLLDDGVRIGGAGLMKSQDTAARVGSFNFEGNAIFAEAIQIEIGLFEFEDLDVALGQTAEGPISVLEGVLAGTVEVPKSGPVAGQVDGSVSGLFLNVPIDDLQIEADLLGGSLAIDAAAESASSLLDVQGTVLILEDGVPVTAEGTYRDLDLSSFTGDSMTHSNLDGAFQVEARWNSMSDHRIVIETDLAPSTWNRQKIDYGRIEVDSDDGAVDVLASITTPRGGVEIEGTVLVTDSLTSLTALGGTFSSVRVGDILGVEGISTDLNGSVDLDLQASGIKGAIALQSSTINKATLRGGRLGIGADGDSLLFDGLFDFDTGKIKLVGESQFENAGTGVQAMFQIDSVDVAGLAGMDRVSSSVNMGCSIVGTISGLVDSELSGLCLATRSRIGRTVVDSLRVAADLISGTLSIDTVVVRSNVADIDGTGSVYFSQSIPTDSVDAVSDLSMDVVVKELDHLEDVLGLDLLEGEGIVEVSVTGKPGSPDILIEPNLEYLSYNNVRSASIDGYVSVEDLEQLDIEAVIDVGFSVIGGFPVQQTSISLLGDQESVVFVANVTQLTGRRGTLSATYTPSIDRSELRIDDLTLNLRGVVWKLDQEAVIEIGDMWTVKHFLIYHEEGQIAIDGVIDRDGEQNLILTAEEVETSAFIDLFGIEDVGGALEGYLVLGGPANDLVADAFFRIRDLSTLGMDRGNLQLGMKLAEGRLHTDGKIDHISGHGATLSGSVPVNLTLEGEQTVSEVDPLDLVISSDSLEVDWTLPFLDRRLVSDIGGLLDGDLSISGTWEDPDLEGAGTINGGQAILPDFNTALGDIDADFSLTGDVLTINHLNATTGDGSITGTGHVDFETISDLGLGLDVKFDNFRAIETNTYRFTVSGEAQVSGSMRAPVVSADVSVGPGDVFMTEELLADEVESISLTSRDLRTLERRFGYRVASSDTSTSDFINALTLDARVNIGRDVWLRSASNPAMDIEFRGDLTVEKQPSSDQRLTGTINVNPSRSRIIQFARRFGVDRGNITFNGLVEDAVIDFRAEYIVPSRFGGDEVRILLAVTGLMDELRLDITSEPQMDDASIASYLLTGRPPDQATVSGEQAAEIAIGGVSRLVEGFANENLGLDVVEIEASGTQGTRLTVGKYISPRTYVFVKQPINTDTNSNQNNGNRRTEIGMEYELFSWLITEVASRNGSFRGNLRWQISF